MRKAIALGFLATLSAFCSSAHATELVFDCGSGQVNFGAGLVDACPGFTAPLGNVVTDVVLSYSLMAVSSQGPDGQLAPATLDVTVPTGFNPTDMTYEFTEIGAQIISIPVGATEGGLSLSDFDPFSVSITREPEASPTANTSASVSVTYEFAEARLPTSGVPEPEVWSLLIVGFGFIELLYRRRRVLPVAA